MNETFVKIMLWVIGILLVLFILFPILTDKAPIRPHENDVVFEGYAIVALVCYNCTTVFDRSDDWEYINGRIHCNNCIRSSENDYKVNELKVRLEK